ncbi:uncharacterized protein LOC100572662 isoform X2 [Acyrthosiphon pisum]|uniref:Cilia- and flagella-associated protein 126 n=1 Tax=Acyrthosiphon pisum TaxID=7029 RepID=A0A8R2A9H1_ACYPI|nr:uncharacterized protein LOC100572662 isoform X2 [Acyrthosiphon pisum]|eukprot:XP_003246417.2 PREDICTED: uncharacterized protein LOC100572662 [Acyrthosiphon pisum]
MSMNYTCNQFDKAYQPTRLGNWEVPKWHLNRPKGRSTVTKVIANDRGHLLPGVQKTDQKHWAGLYLGTYQLPKRISKEIATELSGPKCQTWMKRSYHHPFIDRSQRNKTEKGENNNKLELINANKEQRQQPIANEEADRDSIKSVKSAVSDMPAPNVSRIETVRNCASADGRGPLNSTADDDDCDSGSAHRTRQRGAVDGGGAKTPSSPALSRISASCGQLQVAGAEDDDGARPQVASNELPTGRRYGDAQRHHGLPDAIEDAVYRSLQTKRHKHPGLGLNGCWPKCSAVAYKSFNDPGPTQCSKLRVYRPKTSSSSPPPSSADDGNGEKKDPARRRNKNPSRPKTCGPVMTAQQLTDIKLALCWDLDAPFDRNRPPRPPDEPAVFHKVRQQLQTQQQMQQPCAGGPAVIKPQNSSAVMGFVRTAGNCNVDGDGDSELVPEARRTQTRECLMKNRNLSAVMELIPNKEREDGRRLTAGATTTADGVVTAAADRTALSNKSSSSSSACRGKNGSDVNGRNDDACKSEEHDHVHDHDYADHNDDDNDQHHKSNKPGGVQCSTDGSPSDRRCHRPTQHCNSSSAEKEPKPKRHGRHSYRPCLACDDPNVAAASNFKREDECEHYKMAFKAGVPVSTPVRLRTAAAGKPAKHLKVPKPKTTNSDKKKYVIGTLLPPFSMWPGTTARDYPEHWRLTSVYRQAFKPLELRKQPLLQTIYL